MFGGDLRKGRKQRGNHHGKNTDQSNVALKWRETFISFSVCLSCILCSTPAQDRLCDAKLSDIWQLIGSSWAICAFRCHRKKGNIIKMKKRG